MMVNSQIYASTIITYKPLSNINIRNDYSDCNVLLKNSECIFRIIYSVYRILLRIKI